MIRPVASPTELEQVFSLIHAQFPPRSDRERERLYNIVARRFPADRELMLVVSEASGRLVGGALAVQVGQPSAQSEIQLRALALEPDHRGLGLGRQLLERIEATAAASGVTSIRLGTIPDAREFYRKLGYAGRSRMFKHLTGHGISQYGDVDERRRRLAELRERRLRRATE